MKFDLFQSICQNEVDGFIPSEKIMFENFFRQVRLADELDFGCAWVAESHLSSEVQKQNPHAVIPQFRGEIGLNTDILQLAHQVFAKTKKINVGSAIRNILANGGPIAHAEAVRMFMSLHALDPVESRRLEFGFASGRFPYSNRPYGVRPRNDFEERVWPVLKGLIFQEAVEIFLRFLRGEVLSSQDIRPKQLTEKQFRKPAEWEKALELARVSNFAFQPRVAESGRDFAIEVPPFWNFERLGVVPKEAPLELLRLTIGAHDSDTQKLANEFLPVGVFNLSITSDEVIEETHRRMTRDFNPAGGAWQRERMPRTVQVFIDQNRNRAKENADRAIQAFWKAMEGTIDPVKVAQSAGNSLVGDASEIRDLMAERFHPDDRLMLWFDFNNHDTQKVEKSMRTFAEEVVPHLA